MIREDDNPLRVIAPKMHCDTSVTNIPADRNTIVLNAPFKETTVSNTVSIN